MNTSKYGASKILMGSSFWIFVRFIHTRYLVPGIYVSALIVFIILLCISSWYVRRVRSNHIVSIRTGLKSRLIWDWSAVIHTIWASSNSLYTCKMGRDLVRVAGDIRRSVHDYETSYAYDTCWGLMYGLSDWLKIRQKQLKARQSRQNQVYLALPSQKQVRCEAGQSQGSWCVSCTWF